MQPLLVQVVESGKFPTITGLCKVINHDFISGRIRTSHAIKLWIVGVHLRVCLRKTSCRISLLVENLPIAFGELGLVLYGRYPVRHLERKP